MPTYCGRLVFNFSTLRSDPVLFRGTIRGCAEGERGVGVGMRLTNLLRLFSRVNSTSCLIEKKLYYLSIYLVTIIMYSSS